MISPARRGFTLVELLVVVVLGGFLVLSIYQVLITNSRTYAVNNAQIQGQQVLRAGMDVLFSELREVSPRGRDILAMGSDSVAIRSQRAFGIACAVNYGGTPPVVTVLKVGPYFREGDSLFIFADNDPERSSDDVWFGGVIQSVDTTATCGTEPAQRLRIPALASSVDSVRVGAPLRAFDKYTYGLYQVDGEYYLGRRAHSGGSAHPLVGPVIRTRGVAFRYLNQAGAATTVDTLVAQIEITLRYQAGVRDSRNQLVRDSLVARVYPRN